MARIVQKIARETQNARLVTMVKLRVDHRGLTLVDNFELQTSWDAGVKAYEYCVNGSGRLKEAVKACPPSHL